MKIEIIYKAKPELDSLDATILFFPSVGIKITEGGGEYGIYRWLPYPHTRNDVLNAIHQMAGKLQDTWPVEEK